MIRPILLAGVLLLMLSGNSCEPEPKNAQAEKAKEAARSINFGENAEIDNIKRRLQLTADPGKLGFILLMNEAGQPILYEGVKGKITSGGKRLTAPMKQWSVSPNNQLGPSPSDEGTWGSSGEYVYYWNMDGVYRQWNGKYFYSDQPIRLRVEPLVVTLQPQAASR